MKNALLSNPEHFTNQFLTRSSQFALNTGCFQVQLYKKGPDTKSNNFSGQSLEGQKRVSCATVLVRIVAAPKDSSKKVSFA